MMQHQNMQVKPMSARFKLVTSNTIEMFEERLNAFVASLADDEMIVDTKFTTTAVGSQVEYSALLHYKKTEAWA